MWIFRRPLCRLFWCRRILAIGAPLPDGAHTAARDTRDADRPAVLEEQAVAAGPEIPGNDLLQRLLGLLRCPGVHPAEAVGDAVHMGVHAERRLLEGVDEDAIGGFASHAR